MKKSIGFMFWFGLLSSVCANATTYRVTYLGDLGGDYSSAWSINELGQVFGATKTSSGEFVDFIWDSSQGMEVYTESIWEVKQINDSGQVLSHDMLDGYGRANIDGLWLTLPDSFQASSGGGLNNLGEAVGWVFPSTPPHLRIAAYWSNTNQVTILGTLGGNQSSANDINDFRTIVGSSPTYDGAPYARAFIYDEVNGMENLNDLVLPGYAFDFMYSAGGINNDNWIAGTVRENDRLHAVLLTPISPDEPFQLSVMFEGSGSAIITSDTGSINCPTTCSDEFDNGAAVAVTLTATPTNGSSFVGWSGDCVGTDLTCTVLIDRDMNVVAGLAEPFQLSVMFEGSGSAIITSDIGNINCPTTCSDEFDNGVAVTLTAIPINGSSFVGWSGDCVGTDLTCTVLIDRDMNVVAELADTFFPIPEPLPLAANWNPLPDTGQMKCYEHYGNEIDCPVSGEPFYGQDANYKGRDPSYTSMTINEDNSVIDNNTGLMWMQSTADTNGDDSISQDDELVWSTAVNYCNNLSFAGFEDWRMPEVFELESIVDYGRTDKSINPIFFSMGRHWSNTSVSYLNNNNNVWYVDFVNFGYTKSRDKSFDSYIRCVRGEPTDLGLYIEHDNETVSDEATGLMWMQNTADINSDDLVTPDDKLAWKEALAWCEASHFANHYDWRLPNIRELASVTDRSTSSPSINPIFTGTFDDYISSTFRGSTFVYTINFGGAWLKANSAIDPYFIRCVRVEDSEKSTSFPWTMFLPAIIGNSHQ